MIPPNTDQIVVVYTLVVQHQGVDLKFCALRCYIVTCPTGNGASGWLLLRSSLHDPQMVLNVESEVEGGVRKILGTLMRFFSTLPKGELDVSAIEAVLRV